MILKVSMRDWALKVYTVDINDDPGLTLTYSTARATLVAFVLELRKLGVILEQMTELKEYLCLLKKKGRMGVVCPCPGLYTCI